MRSASIVLLLCLCLVPLFGLDEAWIRRRRQTMTKDEVTSGESARSLSSCAGTLVTVSITLDLYAEDTSWEIAKLGGSIVASSNGTYGTGLRFSTVETEVCLEDGGWDCYNFTIRDAFGDGICCAYGNGSYNVMSGDETTLASGGIFAVSETTDFCVGTTLTTSASVRTATTTDATTTKMKTTTTSVKATTTTDAMTTTAASVDATMTDAAITTTPSSPAITLTAVTIIGAGAAGLAASYTLNHHGLVDYVILESSHDLGGRAKKDLTFTNDAYPMDLGPSFIQYPDAIRRIVGRDDMISTPPGTGLPNFANYSYYDFLNDYVAPKDTSKMYYGCRVSSVDYSSGSVTTVCEDGQTFLSEQVIVTVPLPILKEQVIDFNPLLPSEMTVGHPGWMWGGFKILLEFSTDFVRSFCFPDIPGAQGSCINLNGESLFWDISAINKQLDSGNTIVSGYILGKPSDPFVALDDDGIAQLVIQLMDDRYNGQASLYYVNHLVVNWSNNPDVRGTLSSLGYGEPGAQNVNDKVWVAGEAFPVDGENGWVDAGIFSGDDAAKQILKLREGIDDDTWFWRKVWQDLGRD